jgi:uncharacterized membrane protein YebE (DUF533 family)
VDSRDILSIFLRGALGSRGRKRARRAASFMSGQRGFLTASTLLGAAGVAWGIFDSLKGDTAAVAAPAGGQFATSAVTPPPLPGAQAPLPGAQAPPPPAAAVSDAADSSDRLPLEVLRVVRLAVSAARADGTLLPAERALILSHAREAGVEAVVEHELASPHPLVDIVSGVTDPQRKQDLYVLAFTLVRADEHVTGAERVYLAQLAHQLGLDKDAVAALERDTAARIDAQPDSQPQA